MHWVIVFGSQSKGYCMKNKNLDLRRLVKHLLGGELDLFALTGSACNLGVQFASLLLTGGCLGQRHRHLVVIPCTPTKYCHSLWYHSALRMDI